MVAKFGPNGTRRCSTDAATRLRTAALRQAVCRIRTSALRTRRIGPFRATETGSLAPRTACPTARIKPVIMHSEVYRGRPCRAGLGLHRADPPYSSIDHCSSGRPGRLRSGGRGSATGIGYRMHIILDGFRAESRSWRASESGVRRVACERGPAGSAPISGEPTVSACVFTFYGEAVGTSHSGLRLGPRAFSVAVSTICRATLRASRRHTICRVTARCSRSVPAKARPGAEGADGCRMAAENAAPRRAAAYHD